MSKCAGYCGRDLGFFRSGLCADCQRDIAAVQKGVAILRRMNPPWEYRPTRNYEDGDGYSCTDWQRVHFAFVTHDGDRARGGIEYEDSWAHHCFWKLSIFVNDILLLEVEVRESSRAWVEFLAPYFDSIPAVQEWKRKCAAEEKELSLNRQERDQQAAALKQKYGF